MTGATRCGACGADAVTSGVCARCGYAEGESNRCPHCGSVARAEPSGERPRGGVGLALACAVCGGPRVPGGLGGDQAVRALVEAKASLDARTRARATSVAWALLAAFAALFVLGATLKAALGTSLVLAAFAVVPAVLALRARARASVAQGSANEAQARAWAAAALDAARRAPEGITAAELAGQLGIDERRADRLLTELAVQDRTRVDVGDDAQVRYSVEPRLRVREPAEPEDAGDDAADLDAAKDAELGPLDATSDDDGASGRAKGSTR